jgi:hypothetical protein
VSGARPSYRSHEDSLVNDAVESIFSLVPFLLRRVLIDHCHFSIFLGGAIMENDRRALSKDSALNALEDLRIFSSLAGIKTGLVDVLSSLESPRDVRTLVTCIFEHPQSKDNPFYIHTCAHIYKRSLAVFRKPEDEAQIYHDMIMFSERLMENGHVAVAFNLSSTVGLWSPPHSNEANAASGAWKCQILRIAEKDLNYAVNEAKRHELCILLRRNQRKSAFEETHAEVSATLAKRVEAQQVSASLQVLANT